MTREDAIKVIDERMQFYREVILCDSKPNSDFKKFIAEQYEAFKIALNSMKCSFETEEVPVYVCYEMNRGDLVLECGNISDEVVFFSQERAANWVMKRISTGEDDNFKIDEEYGSVSKENVIRDIEKNDLSITMFYKRQENWNESYDIVVERFNAVQEKKRDAAAERLKEVENMLTEAYGAGGEYVDGLISRYWENFNKRGDRQDAEN